YPNGPLEFSLTIESDISMNVGSIAVSIYNQTGTILVNADTISIGRNVELKTGKNIVTIRIENLYLNPDIYMLGLWLDKTGNSQSGSQALDYIESACEIEVVNFRSEEFGMQTLGYVTCNFNVLEVN
ncbi:MAG: ABC transporter ATP-binding protein, partial [Symploca sp. SIO1A3]|nr:ABC transporter ATP-binding protein [Symploca sp. SIO1A3]